MKSRQMLLCICFCLPSTFACSKLFISHNCLFWYYDKIGKNIWHTAESFTVVGKTCWGTANILMKLIMSITKKKMGNALSGWSRHTKALKWDVLLPSIKWFVLHKVNGAQDIKVFLPFGALPIPSHWCWGPQALYLFLFSWRFPRTIHFGWHFYCI